MLKLEKEDIVYYEEIGKIKAYKINFNNPLILSYLEIVLKDKRLSEAKVKVRIKDLQDLTGICKSAAIFGSYVTQKKNPSDIDIMFVFEPNNLRLFNKKLDKIRELVPYKIHDVIQAEHDLVNNIKKEDKIITGIIREGVILWGFDVIARSIKNAAHECYQAQKTRIYLRASKDGE